MLSDTYLYIDREDGSSQLGPVFKGVNCLAFFVVMCGECELNIIMLDDAGEELCNHYIATRVRA